MAIGEINNENDRVDQTYYASLWKIALSGGPRSLAAEFSGCFEDISDVTVLFSMLLLT